MIHCFLPALLGLLCSAHAQTNATPSSVIVVIDGKKNPSQIPEWVTWEQAFIILAAWRGKDSGFTHDLREAFSKEEFETLEHEAVAQDERGAQAAREAEPLRALYANLDSADQKALATLNDRMQDINLKYRRATLEARNRVLEAFSPESQSLLLSWIGDVRADIISRVPKTDLERWRAPE